MRHSNALILVAATATSIAACGVESSTPSTTPPPVPSTSTEMILVDATCQARNIGALYGLVLEGPEVPEPTTIPSDFSPSSVITCEPDWTDGNADDTAVWVETHREGDLELVLRAYGEDSEPRDWSCHADQVIPPTVWLVNKQGNGLRPALPQTACGAYKFDAITAIEQLPVTNRSAREVAVTP